MSIFCKICGRNIDNGSFCNYCEPNQSNKNFQQVGYLNYNNNQRDGFSVIEPVKSDKRLLNHILDLFGVLTFSLFIWFFLDAIGKSQIIYDMDQDILFIGATFSYYVFFESIWKKTPGKWITKTKVVMRDGSEPSVGNIAIRSFARLIPFEALSFFGERPIGWHDKLSETLVVSDK